MSEELKDRTVLVTGASRGIGLASAHEIADAGATVAMIARDQGRADQAAAEIPGGRGRGYVCDVSDPDQVDRVVEQIESDLGPIQVLVNNAGVTSDKLLIRIKNEDWDRVMNVNLKGTFYMTRAVSRSMIRQREGVIINVSSVVGIAGNPGQASYVAAKAGIIGFTKAVAKELAARGIRANVVAPGFIDTQMTADLPDATRERLLSQIAMGRFGEPNDVAPVIRFLAGPGARYITGQVVVVDGGMVM